MVFRKKVSALKKDPQLPNQLITLCSGQKTGATIFLNVGLKCCQQTEKNCLNNGNSDCNYDNNVFDYVCLFI